MWALNQVSKSDHVNLLRDARDCALVYGLVLRYPSLGNDNCVAHSPFTIFPTPFPASQYRKCLDAQPIVNSLLAKVANDQGFIEDTLKDLIKVDDFTKKLLDINTTVLKEGLAQPVISCISRSDYLLHKLPNSDSIHFEARQVEVNAIASAMSAQSFNVHRVHDYLLGKYRIKKPKNFVGMAENDSLECVAQGLIDAYDSYKHSYDAYILLVAEDRSFNFSDHCHIELQIKKMRPDIKFIRKRFIDLSVNIDDNANSIMKLGPNRELLIDNHKEIAVVYFRYCYDPSNYSLSEKSWLTRLSLERSRAVKCPSINFQLAGAKKFQQVLNSRKELERFLSSTESERLEKLFCKFWPLDSDEGFDAGLNSPETLVLKPQREGGGHNTFGNEITDFIKQLSVKEDRSQYILMEYIDSPKEKNFLLLHQDDWGAFASSSNVLEHHQLVSELGIYGSVLANGNSIITNSKGGYLIRSKKFGVKEGGVASGYAGLSSLMLYDDSRDDLDRLIYYDA